MKLSTAKDIDALLAELDIGAGDRICVHAFVPSLGMVKGGLRTISDVITSRLGERGTLIVPTFTASYRRNEVYDVNASKSFNGAMSEYVRKQPGAVRSLCPLFSMAAVGADAAYLMARPTSQCFGHGSVYEKLFAADVKFVSFGIGWDQGYSFFMHLERLAHIPSRRDDTFRGKTRLPDGRLIDDEAVHYVRVECPKWRRDRGRIADALHERGAFCEVERDGCIHRTFYSSQLQQATLSLLTDDPWCMTDRAKVAA
jgi:aminoglycoside 3-N-acetyltransferase